MVDWSTGGRVADGAGNLTYDGTLTYGYDAESRLTGITQGATTVAAYAYAAQGRRKSKTVGSATTLYVTDADNREVVEYNGTGGELQAWYAFGPGADAVLNRMNVTAASRQTMIPDIQGSIIGTLDSGGTLSKAGYQPFGENPTTTTGSFRYTGRRIDPETGGSASQPSGLYYYWARMYSPAWGRFLQPDPIGCAGGSNLYAYVDNDPLNLVDPYGRAPDGPEGTGTYGAEGSSLTIENGTAVLTVPRLPEYMATAGADQPADGPVLAFGVEAGAASGTGVVGGGGIAFVQSSSGTYAQFYIAGGQTYGEGGVGSGSGYGQHIGRRLYRSLSWRVWRRRRGGKR